MSPSASTLDHVGGLSLAAQDAGWRLEELRGQDGKLAWAGELCPVQGGQTQKERPSLAKTPVIIRSPREDVLLSHSLWPGQEYVTLPQAPVSPGWDVQCTLN